MDWDRMRNEWQSQTGPTGADDASLPREADRLWRRVRLRDQAETLVALSMVPIFGAMAWGLWLGGLMLPAAFAVWLAAICVMIPLRLRSARKRFPARESNLPLRTFLQRERRALIKQHRLLSSVLWWYTGPIMVGALGLFISIRGLHWHSLAYTVAVLAIGFAIERANKAAVRGQIEPAIRFLDEQIQQLEKNDDA